MGRAASSVGSSLAVADVAKRFGSIDVLRGVSLSVQPGQICALLGPSGSGKTTLLRAIAGLERPDRGRVSVGHRVLSDANGAWVPPEQRRIGMVFQDWALFPQMTVAANVAFGLSRAERRTSRVGEVLDMVGLAAFADRQPGTLSGGQQQRVALARALAPRPEVLLLDEPFSNLDTALRVKVRADVHRLLAETAITAVFVTHDRAEAFVLGDVVAVVSEGVIEQVGSPVDLYRRPATPWVAGFVGDANLLTGQASGAEADTIVGPVPLASWARGCVNVLVRPEHVRLDAGGDAVVVLVEYYGHDTVMLVETRRGDMVRVRTPDTTLQRGDDVTVSYAGPPTTAYQR
jgi:iron(III) transport system ATP-binding protein